MTTYRYHHTDGRPLFYTTANARVLCPRCASEGGASHSAADPAWRIDAGEAINPGDVIVCDCCKQRLDTTRETPEGQGNDTPRRYDVRASCYELHGTGSDGAYSLIANGQTPEEVCAALLAVLKGGFGLTHAGPCRLAVHIGPAGSGDDLPL